MANKLLLLGALILVPVVVAAWWDTHGTASSGSTTSLASSPTPRSAPNTPIAGKRSQLRGTPQVVANRLTWRVISSHTSRRIENEYLPATAEGTYLIMDVVAANGTSEPVPLDNAHIRLDLGGTEYPLSADGVTALELGGHKPLAAPVLDPTATASGWVAFDVPPGAATSAAELCLDEEPGSAATASPC